MHTIFFFFFFFFFFFLSPPPHIFATAETKKEACPLLGENAGAAAVTRSYDDEAIKPLISSCGNSISKSGACATCASAIDALILSRMNLTSEELKEFDMKSCAAFFIQSGASVKTLLGMKECKREDSSAYRVLLNEENGRKQKEEDDNYLAEFEAVAIEENEALEQALAANLRTILRHQLEQNEALAAKDAEWEQVVTAKVRHIMIAFVLLQRD